MAYRVKTPWHLWLVGGLLTFFNGYGLVDFIGTQMDADWLMESFTAEQRAYFAGLPLWMDTLWGVSVVAAFIASLCLLLRMKLAVPLFMGSVIGYVLSSAHNMVINPMPGGGSAGLIMAAFIFVVLLVALLYARGMRKKGVLN